MPRLTTAQKEAVDLERAEQALSERTAFLARLPARLWDLSTLAEKANVRTETELTMYGAKLTLMFTDANEASFEFGEPAYAPEEWEVDEASDRLQRMLQEKAEREERRMLAKATVQSLTPEQLAAVKEFGLTA